MNKFIKLTQCYGNYGVGDPTSFIYINPDHIVYIQPIDNGKTLVSEITMLSEKVDPKIYVRESCDDIKRIVAESL